MTDPIRRIGGSMIAKILKKSKWGTPLDAYLELTGERPQEDKTGEDIDRGNFLEPSILKWASKKTGTQFFKPMAPAVITSKVWDWATVSPDGLSHRDPGAELLEIKAPRRDDALQWGEEGSDEAPTDALLQTHWGMMVADAKSGIIAALLGGELRIFRVKRDLDLEAKMLAAARSFVDGHVLPRVPPPPEFGDDKNVLYRHPLNTLPHRAWDALSAEERTAVVAYLEAYKAHSFAEKLKERWNPVVKEIVGDTAGIDGIPPEHGKRIDWKANESAGPHWKTIAEKAMASWPEEERVKLTAENMLSPPRVFRPWFHKEGKKK